jgi:hypothetical protein
MAQKLKNNLTIQRLAADLGLRSSEDPVRAIVGYCHRQVKKFLSDYPNCPTPAELLTLVANKLGTKFIDVHSDADVQRVRGEFLSKGEASFVSLEQELSDDTFGVTLKRQRHNPTWEQPYVSVIDCRGYKNLKAYFTKWHELGHLLILTDQTRLVFKRTHALHDPKSPEESLVDVIAGSFAYYPPMVRPLAVGEITFESIERIRQVLCPDGSFQSALIGISQAWPLPCVLLEARIAARKQDFDATHSALRAVRVSVNEAASRYGIEMFPNWRVPQRSVISQVFESGMGFGEKLENLEWWETSDGKKLDARNVKVSAKLIAGSVFALITCN